MHLLDIGNTDITDNCQIEAFVLLDLSAFLWIRSDVACCDDFSAISGIWSTNGYWTRDMCVYLYG